MDHVFEDVLKDAEEFVEEMEKNAERLKTEMDEAMESYALLNSLLFG